jgi:hypothetical protein
MKMKLNLTLYFLLFLAVTLSACKNGTKQAKTATPNPEDLPANNLTFRDVNGIRFYEVKRRFKNGLSFNEVGFQQEPTWIIQFKYPDTMLAYSPDKKGMEAFYLHFDHGRVYNFAREFFRVRIISKDSLVLQRLQVNAKIIAGDDDERSNVYCTFYTKNYIENVLKTTVGELQKPTKADTIFIKKLAEKTYEDPGNPKLAFAGRQPVIFTPKSKAVTVEKISTVDELSNRTLAYDYIYPEYRIVINNAYKAFANRTHLVVDANGNLYVNSVEGVMAENHEARKKMLQGVADIYLKNLFKITPGSTLGIPHSSEVTINLVGKPEK